MGTWPSTAAELAVRQRELAQLTPDPWQPQDPEALAVAGSWVCFARGLTGPGRAGDAAWAAAVVVRHGQVVARMQTVGQAAAPYSSGLLALRVGALLHDVVRRLHEHADVVLVDGTGRDHPRRAGLAVHLGAVLDRPTVGVTHRPLLATGAWPEDRDGAATHLVLDGVEVGAWVRTRRGTRPLAVHAGWRTTPEVAVDVVRASTRRARTPVPLREARHLARAARSRDDRRGR